jgi:hypothetical protein
MKELFFSMIASIIITINTSAQTATIKYYDIEWSQTTKEKATYYAEFIKDGQNYKCTSYWSISNALRGKSTFQIQY